MNPGGYYIGFKPAGSVPMCAFDAFKGFNKRSPFKPSYITMACVDKDYIGKYTATPRNPVIQIPQGKYQVFFAVLKSPKSKKPFVLDGGSMTALELNSDTYTLKWGAPLKLEFLANRSGSLNEYKIGVNSIKITDSSGANLRFPPGEKRFISPPQVTFYPGTSTRKESAKFFTLKENSDQLGDLSAKVKKSGQYRMVMTAKTKLFGLLEGELTR
jgi:hypothetical protein